MDKPVAFDKFTYTDVLQKVNRVDVEFRLWDGKEIKVKFETLDLTKKSELKVGHKNVIEVVFYPHIYDKKTMKITRTIATPCACRRRPGHFLISVDGKTVCTKEPNKRPIVRNVIAGACQRKPTLVASVKGSKHFYPEIGFTHFDYEDEVGDVTHVKVTATSPQGPAVAMERVGRDGEHKCKVKAHEFNPPNPNDVIRVECVAVRNGRELGGPGSAQATPGFFIKNATGRTHGESSHHINEVTEVLEESEFAVEK